MQQPTENLIVDLHRSDVEHATPYNIEQVQIQFHNKTLKILKRLGEKRDKNGFSQFYGANAAVYLGQLFCLSHVAIKIIFCYEKNDSTRDVEEKFDSMINLHKKLCSFQDSKRFI